MREGRHGGPGHPGGHREHPERRDHGRGGRGGRGELGEHRSHSAQTFRRGRAVAFLDRLLVKRATLLTQLNQPEYDAIKTVISGELKAVDEIIQEFIHTFEIHEIDAQTDNKSDGEDTHNDNNSEHEEPKND